MKQLLTALTFTSAMLVSVVSAPIWADQHDPVEAEQPTSEATDNTAAKPESTGGGIRVTTGDDDGGVSVSLKGAGLEKALDIVREELRNDPRLTEAQRIKAEKDLELAQDIVKDLDMDVAVSGKETAMGLLIALISVILLFGSPVIIIAIVLYASHRKRRLAHETINSYVQSGRDIPPEVFASLQQTAKTTSPKSSLHKGLVTSAVGFGVLAAFSMAGNLTVAALGLIPLFIGLAQLLAWKLDKPSDKNGFGQ